MDYLEFIARVTSHIPDKGQVTIRYFGLYANAHRGKMRKSEEGEHKLLILEEEHPRIPCRGWAEMIRKVYEVDPMVCPKCGGTMKVIAFIVDYTAVACRRRGRLDGGRGRGGIFLIVTVDSFLERKREVLRLSGDFPVVGNDDSAGRPPS
jgi:hypothetical protein